MPSVAVGRRPLRRQCGRGPIRWARPTGPRRDQGLNARARQSPWPLHQPADPAQAVPGRPRAPRHTSPLGQPLVVGEQADMERPVRRRDVGGGRRNSATQRNGPLPRRTWAGRTRAHEAGYSRARRSRPPAQPWRQVVDRSRTNAPASRKRAIARDVVPIRARNHDWRTYSSGERRSSAAPTPGMRYHRADTSRAVVGRRWSVTCDRAEARRAQTRRASRRRCRPARPDSGRPAARALTTPPPRGRQVAGWARSRYAFAGRRLDAGPGRGPPDDQGDAASS